MIAIRILQYYTCKWYEGMSKVRSSGSTVRIQIPGFRIQDQGSDPEFNVRSRISRAVLFLFGFLLHRGFYRRKYYVRSILKLYLVEVNFNVDLHLRFE